MQITPAILTSDLELFTRLVKTMTFLDSLDIDIIRPPFVDNNTVQFNQINDLVNYNNTSIGFHLMVSNPIVDLQEMIKCNLSQQSLRIYLHQESDLSFLNSFEWPKNWTKCVAVKIETELSSIDFYNQFDEVQLMSIQTGKQGNLFNKQVLERVNTLRDLGFNKKISIDGGVNLDSAELIKGSSIDRVSVGSYFQKSQNPQESYRILNERLNN